MMKSRLYTTVLAVLGGMIFAYALVQIQHNQSFLLGDIMRLSLPEWFHGVYYSLDDDILQIGHEWLTPWEPLLVEVSYNTDRVSIDSTDIESDYAIAIVSHENGLLRFSLTVWENTDIVHLPFVSDKEYHIVVSSAVIDQNQPLAIQRL